MGNTELNQWTHYLFSVVRNVHELHCRNKANTKHINVAVSSICNNFSKSVHFFDSITSTFQIPEMTELHLSIGVNALLKVQDIFYLHLSRTNKPAEEDVAPYMVSGVNMAKIRYVGGMCVGKVIYRNTGFVCRNAHKDIPDLLTTKRTIQTLKGHIFSTPFIAADETKYPDSLSEINHRQTKYGHLTIIDDTLLDLFVEFERALMPYLSCQSIAKYHDTLFTSTFQLVKNYMETIIYPNYTDSISWGSLEQAFKIYLKVCLKELGNKVVREKAIDKKLSHRKQVMLDEHNENPSKKPRQEDNNPTPSTSTGQYISNIHPTQEIMEDEDTCVKCGGEYALNEQWIMCCNCSQWRHRKCDYRLRGKKAWESFLPEDAVYLCPACTKVQGTIPIFQWFINTMTFHNYDKACTYFFGWEAIFLLIVSATAGVQEPVLAFLEIGVCPSTMDGIAFLHERKWNIESHVD